MIKIDLSCVSGVEQRRIILWVQISPEDEAKTIEDWTGATYDQSECCFVLSGFLSSESAHSDPLVSVWDISGQL